VFDTYRHAPVYFVSFCTYQRNPWLARPNLHAAFLAFIQRGWQEHRIAVGRYVIMPDHIHLLVSGGPAFNVGDWVKLLKECLGKAIRASHSPDLGIGVKDEATTARRAPHRGAATPDTATPGSANRLWQEGFFDHLIRSDEKLGSIWEYLRQNPQTAGLTEAPEDWPYQGEFMVLDRA